MSTDTKSIFYTWINVCDGNSKCVANACECGPCMWLYGVQCIKCLFQMLFIQMWCHPFALAYSDCVSYWPHITLCCNLSKFNFSLANVLAVGLIAAIKKFYRITKVVHMLTDWMKHFSSYFQQSHISIVYIFIKFIGSKRHRERRAKRTTIRR